MWLNVHDLIICCASTVNSCLVGCDPSSLQVYLRFQLQHPNMHFYHMVSLSLTLASGNLSEFYQYAVSQLNLGLRFKICLKLLNILWKPLNTIVELKCHTNLECDLFTPSIVSFFFFMGISIHDAYTTWFSNDEDQMFTMLTWEKGHASQGLCEQKSIYFLLQKFT